MADTNMLVTLPWLPEWQLQTLPPPSCDLMLLAAITQRASGGTLRSQPASQRFASCGLPAVNVSGRPCVLCASVRLGGATISLGFWPALSSRVRRRPAVGERRGSVVLAQGPERAARRRVGCLVGVLQALRCLHQSALYLPRILTGKRGSMRARGRAMLGSLYLLLRLASAGRWCSGLTLRSVLRELSMPPSISTFFRGLHT